MKIAHVTSLLSRRSAGLGTAIQSLARAQQELGHDVYIIGQADRDYIDRDHSNFEGLSVRACSVTGPERLGYSRRMVHEICHVAPDVVHLHGLWLGISHSVLQAHRRSGVPYVISIHGMLGKVPLTYSSGKKRLARVLFQDACFAKATCLQATSVFEVEEIRAFGLQKPVFLIPNGVSPLPVPVRRPRPDRKTVLSLGRVHRKKGLDVLIEAWARLEPDFPDWQVAIVGPDEGGHSAELQAQIDRLGLTRCHISGPVYGEARDALMAGAEIFALPTRSENFALTVGESLMLEVPVVSSKGAPWPGLETEGCGLWVDLQPESFAAALQKVMTLPVEARRAMGRRGRAWMLRDFTWSAVAAQALEAYDWMSDRRLAPASLIEGPPS